MQIKSFKQYVEARDRCKKKGLKLTWDVEGEPVVVGKQKKEAAENKYAERRRA